jgi:hypothetical protein
MSSLQRNHQLKGLDKKKQKAQAGRPTPNFYSIYSVYQSRRGDCVTIPHFIYRTKPTAYAKKGVLRVLTSFRRGGRGRAQQSIRNRGRREGQTSPWPTSAPKGLAIFSAAALNQLESYRSQNGKNVQYCSLPQAYAGVPRFMMKILSRYRYQQGGGTLSPFSKDTRECRR